MPALVTDRKKHAVDGLKGSDFSIYEDGKLQKISSFAAVEQPISLVTPAPAGTERRIDGPPESLVGSMFQNVQELNANFRLNNASGVQQGYAEVRRTAGSNQFIAYAVINDGAGPGQRTGDGAYVGSSE